MLPVMLIHLSPLTLIMPLTLMIIIVPFRPKMTLEALKERKSVFWACPTVMTIIPGPVAVMRRRRRSPKSEQQADEYDYFAHGLRIPR
jgi:hypothetical protein